MVKKISQNEFNEVTASEVAVIDFSATWCGPCKMLAPVLDEVSEEYAGKVNFFNVDVDENPDLAMQYKIMNIPALVVLKKGEKVDTQVGFAPKENIFAYMLERFDMKTHSWVFCYESAKGFGILSDLYEDLDSSFEDVILED